MLTVILLFSVSLTHSQKDEVEATRQAVCRRVEDAPRLDGKLDDPAWSKAEVIDSFPAFWSGTKSTGSTKARLLWTDEGLYFAGEMTDKELRSFGKNRNDSLWNGDVFELFFKPSPKSRQYYEFQANPKALTFELQIPGNEKPDRPTLGMKAVASLRGTLDHPGDLDQGWTVEGMIPWSAFGPSGGKPKAGDVWTFAICRYDYGPEGTQPVLTSCAPLRKPSFHKTEDYARLVFERTSDK